MSSQPSYRHLLETSQRVNWRLEDLVGDDRHLDFSRPFLPETFARTESLGFLRSAEKLALNQIRARGYLALFELVEALVVPFISRQAEEGEASEPYRAQPWRTSPPRSKSTASSSEPYSMTSMRSSPRAAV